MITQRTKVQLLIFVIITLVGVTYVGARYARLDRYIRSDSYEVTAHFTDSGGVFAGAAVAYRGDKIGTVKELDLTKDGVDVVMDIDNDNDEIPSDAKALVANKSAVGEQYVDLQPQSNKGPFLGSGSEIANENTAIPIQTDQILGDLQKTVSSVDKASLQTTVSELGQAFNGTGEDLQKIIDTSNSFIDLANQNFDTTTALIRDGNTVLNGQIASESALRTFARDLSLFSDTLAGSDTDIRRLLDTGSAATTQLRTFIEQNNVDLSSLLNNLVTTGQIIVRNLDGVKVVLSVYPYVVAGGFTVVSKSPDTGLYDAHFGLVLTTSPICHQGYESTDTRPPSDGSNRPMNEKARCTEPASKANARGAQNLPANPRAAASYLPPAPLSDDQAPIAAYDPETGKVTWGADKAAALESRSTVAPPTLGKESWKWLFLQPLTSGQQ